MGVTPDPRGIYEDKRDSGPYLLILKEIGQVPRFARDDNFRSSRSCHPEVRLAGWETDRNPGYGKSCKHAGAAGFA
jgi:hypothetical protein